MKNLLALKAWLEGKKTYILAAFTAGQGLWQYLVSHGISLHTVVTYLTVGGGLASLRAALTKVGLAVTAKKK